MSKDIPSDSFGWLDSQIDKLANFIMKEVPGEPSLNEGAVDTAIRIIKEYQEKETLTDKWINEHSYYVPDREASMVYASDLSNVDLHPSEKKVIPPDEFINYAIKNGLIVFEKEALDDYKEKIINSHVEGKEMLSKDWIDKYKHYYPVTEHNKSGQEILNVEDVRKLMLFGKYIPVIPKFLDQWIEHKKNLTLRHIFNIAKENDRVSKWLHGNNMITNMQREFDLVIALRTGYYEVEKEKRFYVLGADDRTMLVRKMDHGIISTGDLIHVDELMGSERDSHALTEDEIKGYDERYWEFRREVDEDFNLID